MATPKAPIAVYVHWPFCMAKCPYCDFNSHVSRSIDQSAWQDALLADLDAQAALLGPREVASVFFGGGTPSLMESRVVGAVLERLAAVWDMAPDVEVTLEANPTSVEAERFAGYRAAGVNRVSVGIQALNEPDLKALGRMHSVQEALTAFDLASTIFDRTSFDLIYARQHQTLSAWEDELKQALSVCGDHLSLYQLTVEQNTRFGDLYVKGALRGLPSNDLGATMFELTRDMCAGAGFEDYEVSNYARDGQQCRHNLTYWRYNEYCGIGPGAHGRIDINGKRHASKCWSMPAAYLKTEGFEDLAPLDRFDQGVEFLMMGLRLSEGLSTERMKSFFGESYPALAISNFCSDGLLSLKDGKLAATSSGRMVLNTLIEQLVPDQKLSF